MKQYNIAEAISQVENSLYVSAVEQGGRVLDVTRTSFIPACHIKRVTKELYMKGKYDKEGNFITTGEVHEVVKKEYPMRNRRSLRRIFKDLRRKITHNFSGGINELFITLTYRGEEQTSDPRQVHTDFKCFWQRLKRTFSEKNLSYISIVEPHASGKFHIHLLLRENDGEHLYIPFQELEAIWGHGSVKVERLEEVDHMGAYFIAYFSNLELSEEEAERFEAEDDIEEKNGKKYIKGKRLDFYPDGMQIARSSRDLSKPAKLDREATVEALARASSLRGAYEKTIITVDKLGKEREAHIRCEQYNIKNKA